MATIGENLQQVKARLAGARGVTLLAVSKSQPVDAIRAAVAAGQTAFGENYVQEAIEKMNTLPALEWHLIGPLQSNKTRVVAERFDWVQTVASEKIARRLSEQRPASLAPLNVLIQVNASGEPTKSGVAPEQPRLGVKSRRSGLVGHADLSAELGEAVECTLIGGSHVRRGDDA